MSQKKPSDYHPHLTDDRLSAIAEMLFSARYEAAQLHDPKSGDDAWSLGCRGFAWCRNRLLRKTASRDWPWLGIVSASKRLIVRIGDVPVRFYRGISDNPPQKTLANWSDETQQLVFAFGEDSDLKDMKWRFVIETGFLGEPIKVIFAGYTDAGKVYCSWDIRTPAEILKLTPPLNNIPAGVEIAAPTVELPLQRDRASKTNE